MDYRRFEAAAAWGVWHCCCPVLPVPAGILVGRIANPSQMEWHSVLLWSRLRAVLFFTAVFWAAAADGEAPPSPAGGTTPPPAPAKPVGSAQQADNSLCYVCHLSLQKEELTARHQAQGIGCTDCHGTSSEHMHDEMLMTKADRLFGRREVNAMCVECHDQPHEDKPQEFKVFLEKWRGRDRPNGRVITDDSICTDCHGVHVLAQKADAGQNTADDWLPAFNGRDLAGWQASPGDAWKVDRGRIIALPRTAASRPTCGVTRCTATFASRSRSAGKGRCRRESGSAGSRPRWVRVSRSSPAARRPQGLAAYTCRARGWPW